MSCFGWQPACCAAALLSTATLMADFQGAMHLMPFDEDTIAYSKTPDSGPIARLQAKIDKGKTTLPFDEKEGYLHALLDELKIPRSSQMLVFSKTSFQRERISPDSPRALFFNDEVYVGYIPGSPLMEVSAVDPKLGGVFYTLEQKKSAKPRFMRTDQCLECHASAKTMGVPGHLVRSFFTDENGVVDLVSGTSLVNHRTPLAERWGGWYVTGNTGKQRHRGNLFSSDAEDEKEKLATHEHNRTNLAGFFDVSKYPSASSDIVALMVLEHQVHMHNFITRLNYGAVLALKQYGHLNYMTSAIDAFIKYLLFAEEAALTEPIKGTSGFAEWFSMQGPKDKTGRSLRELDLQTRLFKYPCSFLIYSEAFESLPAQLKERIYGKLFEILATESPSDEFGNLSSESRQVIYEILRDTKSGLPVSWNK
jgi:hypothetical protein